MKNTPSSPLETGVELGKEREVDAVREATERELVGVVVGKAVVVVVKAVVAETVDSSESLILLDAGVRSNFEVAVVSFSFFSSSITDSTSSGEEKNMFSSAAFGVPQT